MNNKKFYVRKFLNKKEGLAAIEVHGLSFRKDHYDSGSVDMSITITDCSRKITLDFDNRYSEGTPNLTEKFDTLIDVITKAKEFFVTNTNYRNSDEQ